MPQPRLLSICVFRHKSSILVAQGFDQHKNQHFFRPIGGEVEFGETAVEAIHREVAEELGERIQNVRRLAVLENLFEYEGHPCHEIVFVHDGEFRNACLYQEKEIPIREEVWVGPARWMDLTHRPEYPLYPDGLYKILIAAASMKSSSQESL